jgi:hypothetical protein
MRFARSLVLECRCGVLRIRDYQSSDELFRLLGVRLNLVLAAANRSAGTPEAVDVVQGQPDSPPDQREDDPWEIGVSERDQQRVQGNEARHDRRTSTVPVTSSINVNVAA